MEFSINAIVTIMFGTIAFAGYVGYTFGTFYNNEKLNEMTDRVNAVLKPQFDMQDRANKIKHLEKLSDAIKQHIDSNINQIQHQKDNIKQREEFISKKQDEIGVLKSKLMLTNTELNELKIVKHFKIS